MILFAVMTNNLLRDWHLRIKFVDDTTALEILRNGINLLNVAVNDIHKFSIEHYMKLNPKKCKEMLKNLDESPRLNFVRTNRKRQGNSAFHTLHIYQNCQRANKMNNKSKHHTDEHF